VRTVALAIAVAALGASPARADTTTRYEAPFPCGSDELSRRTGVLAAPSDLPRIPSQTHGCPSSPFDGAGVWASLTAASHVTVHADASGSVCVFAQMTMSCDGDVSVDTQPGDELVVGALVPDPGPSVMILRAVEAIRS
jgi:hypothetical protein